MIRRGTTNDAAALSLLHNAAFTQSYDPPWTFQQFVDFLQTSTEQKQIFCLEKNKQIVGMLAEMETDDCVEILTVAVLPHYVRQKIATTLFQHSFGLHADKNFSLEVAKSNAPAIALYQRLGFKQVRERKRYYVSNDKQGCEDAIVMIRQIY
jgi:ribosomal-protein-alanine N-acetyltransferase